MFELRDLILSRFNYAPNRFLASLSGLFKGRSDSNSDATHGRAQNLVLADYKYAQTKNLKSALNDSEITEEEILTQLSQFANDLFNARHGGKVNKKRDYIPITNNLLKDAMIGKINRQLGNTGYTNQKIIELINKGKISVKLPVHRGLYPGSCEENLIKIINDFLNTTDYSHNITAAQRTSLEKTVNKLSQYYEESDLTFEPIVYDYRVPAMPYPRHW